jgi:hypothetical protein
MKAKKILIMALALLTLGVFFAGQATAAAVRICNVMEAGYNDETGNIEIWLQQYDGGNTKMFTAAVGQEKEMLAVALSALSTGLPVKAKLNWNTWGSALLFIRLMSSAPVE